MQPRPTARDWPANPGFRVARSLVARLQFGPRSCSLASLRPLIPRRPPGSERPFSNDAARRPLPSGTTSSSIEPPPGYLAEPVGSPALIFSVGHQALEPGRGHVLAFREEDEAVTTHAVKSPKNDCLCPVKPKMPSGTGIPTLTPTMPPSVRKQIRGRSGRFPYRSPSHWRSGSHS